MKLRCSFSSRQRLFALGFAFFLVFDHQFRAFAQDQLITKDGKTQEVKILGANGSTVQIRVGGGSIGIPLSTVASVVMAAPAELAAANAAFEARDYAKALPIAQAVAKKYKGLPVDWARQATSLVGDIHVALGHLAEAEAVYKEYQKIYPGAGTVQTDVGIARIAVARKEYETARQKLEPIATAALKQKKPSRVVALAYSQTFFLLGQIAEAQGKPKLALENYLRTVTLFHEDHSAASAAQQRADELRKKDPNLTVP